MEKQVEEKNIEEVIDKVSENKTLKNKKLNKIMVSLYYILLICVFIVSLISHNFKVASVVIASSTMPIIIFVLINIMNRY